VTVEEVVAVQEVMLDLKAVTNPTNQRTNDKCLHSSLQIEYESNSDRMMAQSHHDDVE